MSDSPLSKVKFWLPNEIENFEKHAAYIKYKKKANLFWAGDESATVYFIVSGFVKMFHFTPNGDKITLLLHKPGDILGIDGALKGMVREVSAETTGPCELWEFSKEKFMEFMYKYPKFAIWVATDLASRMKCIDQSLYYVVSLSAECRLALALLDLAESNSDEASPIEATVKATHQDLANLIGICRQTTTTILGDFRNQGIICTGNGHIDIYDLSAIKEKTAESGRNV